MCISLDYKAEGFEGYKIAIVNIILKEIKMKLGIIVGHNQRQQGANGIDPINASEFLYNKKIAEIMKANAKSFSLKSKIFNRKYRGSYRDEIAEVYGKSDDWGAEVTVELHFNAYNRNTRGTETLCYESEASLRTGNAIHRELIQLFNRDRNTDRGIKTYRNLTRGRYSLVAGSAPAVLVEPFFGDNFTDAQLATNIGKKQIALSYLRGIAKSWNLVPQDTIMAQVDTEEDNSFAT